jgi:hypothetical protein
MVVVKMGEENGSDIPDINSGFGDPTRRAIASVNDVERSIDNQQVRSLRPMGFRSRAGSRTESNDARASLRPGRPSLGRCDAGQGRQRGSASSNAQELTAKNFHSSLPTAQALAFYLSAPSLRKGEQFRLWPIASVPQFGLSPLLAEPDIVTQIDR